MTMQQGDEKTRQRNAHLQCLYQNRLHSIVAVAQPQLTILISAKAIQAAI